MSGSDCKELRNFRSGDECAHFVLISPSSSEGESGEDEAAIIFCYSLSDRVSRSNG